MLVGSLHTQDNCLTPRASPCLLRIYGDVTGPGRRIKFLRPTAFGILFGARALSRHHIFFVYSENHSQCDNYLLAKCPRVPNKHLKIYKLQVSCQKMTSKTENKKDKR